MILKITWFRLDFDFQNYCFVVILIFKIIKLGGFAHLCTQLSTFVQSTLRSANNKTWPTCFVCFSGSKFTQNGPVYQMLGPTAFAVCHIIVALRRIFTLLRYITTTVSTRDPVHSRHHNDYSSSKCTNQNFIFHAWFIIISLKAKTIIYWNL